MSLGVLSVSSLFAITTYLRTYLPRIQDQGGRNRSPRMEVYPQKAGIAIYGD